MKKLSKEEVRDRYNDFSKWYDILETFSELIVGRYRKKMLKEVNGNILDVGIGTGANLRYYHEKCKITGIDLSEGMLQKAKIKAKSMGIKAKLVMGDSERLQFKNDTFDYVVDSLGMCSYPNSVNALKEMKRVCKKGGKVLLIEHGISNKKFIRWLQEKREEKHYSKIGCSLIKDYKDILNKTGIKKYDVERKLFGIIWMIKIKG